MLFIGGNHWFPLHRLAVQDLQNSFPVVLFAVLGVCMRAGRSFGSADVADASCSATACII